MVPGGQTQLCAEPARAQARRRHGGCAGVLGRGQDCGGACRTPSCMRCACTRIARRSRPRASRPATASRRTCRTCPKTIIAMLGAASRGAIWSSCSPDFGVQGVLDRFGQIEPRVLFTVDGYWYNGKAMPILDKVAAHRRAAADGRAGRRDSVSAASTAGASDDLSAVRDAVAWDAWLAPFLPGPIDYVALPFDASALHPVFVGHHRRAEVHRPRRRRHAAAAPEGAPAARRRQARRPPVLFHDLRLDDVELARLGAGVRRDAAAVRRLAVHRARPHAVGVRRRRADDALRHVGQVHRRAEEDRAGAAQGLRARAAARRCSRPAARLRPRASTTSTSA